jgi:hypothetical protein
VIPVALLGVVVQQLLDVGLDESDLGKDFVGRGGPDERFGVAVPVGDVVADPLDENLHRAERAATNRLTGDDARQPSLARRQFTYRAEIIGWLRSRKLVLFGHRTKGIE